MLFPIILSQWPCYAVLFFKQKKNNKKKQQIFQKCVIDVILVFLLLTLNIFSSVSTVDFEL